MYAVSYHMTQRRFRQFDWSRAYNGSYFGRCFYTSSDENEVVNNYNHRSNDKQSFVEQLRDRTELPYDKAYKMAFGRGKYEYLLKCVLTMKKPFMAVSGAFIQHDITSRMMHDLHMHLSDTYSYDVEYFNEQVLDYLRDGISTYNLDKSLRGFDVEYHNPDDNTLIDSGYATGDFIRDFLRFLGYDGIIQEPTLFFPWMYRGLEYVRHYVAFPETKILIVNTQRLPRA
jgi:hypothetical protein